LFLMFLPTVSRFVVSGPESDVFFIVLGPFEFYKNFINPIYDKLLTV